MGFQKMINSHNVPTGQLLQLYDYKVSFVIFQHLQAVLLTHVTQKSGEVCATRFSPILSHVFRNICKNYHRSYEVTFPSQVKRIQDLLQEGPK